MILQNHRSKQKRICMACQVTGITSVMGVSRTLSGPYLSRSPLDIYIQWSIKANCQRCVSSHGIVMEKEGKK